MKTDQGLECWGVCIVATLIQALSIGLENSYGAVQTVRNSFYLGQAFFWTIFRQFNSTGVARF